MGRGLKGAAVVNGEVQLDRIELQPIDTDDLLSCDHSGDEARRHDRCREAAPGRRARRDHRGSDPGLFSHAVVRVDGKVHLLMSIRAAHGDIAGLVVGHVAEAAPGLQRVQQFGTCGGLDAGLALDALTAPAGASIISLTLQATPLRNALRPHSSISSVTHGHVRTLLEEHEDAISRLKLLGVQTVDIEAYHVAEALSPHPGIELRMLHRVSDIPVSPGLGATRAGARSGEGVRIAERRAVLMLDLWSAEEDT